MQHFMCKLLNEKVFTQVFKMILFILLQKSIKRSEFSTFLFLQSEISTNLWIFYIW